MPFGDRTGPAGMGPMTGRGAGYCAGYGMPGYANPIPGRGFGGGRGWGFGGGRGWGFGGGWGRGVGWQGAPGGAAYPYGAYGAPAYNPDPKEELEMLKQHAEYFKGELDAISKRIDELSKEEQK